MKSRFTGKGTAEIRTIARQDANAALSVHWRGEVPVDPFAMATKLGPEVYTAQLGNDVYGLIKGSPSNAQIFLDVDQPMNRMRFTCAHELGHYVDRSSSIDATDEDFAKIDKRSDSGARTEPEIYANEFAASLLMPEMAVRQFHDKGMTRIEMADKFKVSLDAVKFRLINLGLVES